MSAQQLNHDDLQNISAAIVQLDSINGVCLRGTVTVEDGADGVLGFFTLSDTETTFTQFDGA